MTAASSVNISTSAFQFAHGKSPRGVGSWGFIARAQQNADNYLDFVVWFTQMSFSDAKRAAAAHFAAAGIVDVVVCS